MGETSGAEYLTEEEIAAHPEISRVRIGDELVPRCVLFAAQTMPVGAKDVGWAMEEIRARRKPR